MSNTSEVSGAGSRVDPTQQAVVGIHAQPRETNAVLGAILRAQRNGYEVLVGSGAPKTIESIPGITELEVPVIEITDHQHERELEAGESDPEKRCREILTRVARDRGAPGLIYQADPSATIDFEASIERLMTGSEYVITAEPLPAVESEPTTLVGIPAYNEAATIAEVVTEAREHAPEVLVVDDGSDDETAALAAQAGAAVIEHETNRGYGAALQTAFIEADRCGASHLVIMDGDGQHDVSDITELVETQRETGAEITIGSRSVEGAETNIPLYRRFGLAVVNWATNLSFGSVRGEERIEDTQSGFRAYDSTAITSLANADRIGSSMGASIDIIYHAQERDFSLEEVPTTIDYDVENGSSKHPLTHGLNLISNILQVVERKHPVLSLGVPGFICTVVGLGIAYAAIANLINTGTFPLGFGMASIFFVLIGVFSCFTAIILHSLNQLHG